MRTKFLIILFSILFISCEEKYDLKLNLTQGKIYKQTVLTESSIYQDDIDSWPDIRVSTFYKIDYKVTDRKDSIFTISCKLKEMKIGFESDFNTQTIDSKEKDNGNPLNKIISNMVNKEFIIIVNERGKIKEIKNTENLYKNLFDGIPQITEEQKKEIAKTFKESFNDKTFKNNFENGFYMIPSEEIALQESWKNIFTTELDGTKMNLKNTFTLTKYKPNKYAIISGKSFITAKINKNESKADLNGKMTSKYKLNPFNGWIKEALITQEMKGMMEVIQDNQKKKSPIKIYNRIMISGY
ncbi:DUF6263 family protein [Flavobacterium lacisediminis]|uniref:DUF6263 family protein n=1 Tax=Flavobacterium lacisediminis TaxID=2989705 RepID=A0ABT3EGP0_9FLAO|nr:DUF6263 family protein [Flavobacterium lacisediminis]MCW1147707.1 DUF6263 family protein [Flavobacterium lacisediminis]